MRNLTLALAVGLFAATVASASAETIAEVKAAADGTAVTNVTGVVTSVGGGSGRLGFTIQDATGGVLIDKGSVSPTYTVPAVGDNVTISNGTKGSYYGTAQLVPSAATDVVVNSSGNAMPAPQTFASVAAFLAADVLATQSTMVQVEGLYLTGTAPSKAGTTTWLIDTATSGNVNYVATDNGTDTVTLRMPSDLGTSLADWQAKARPDYNAADKFSVVTVACQYNSVNQLQLADPAGTSAKVDTVGPIRSYTSAVSDWTLY